jgi:selenide,water dikinase
MPLPPVPRSDTSGFECISDTLQSEGGPPEVFAVGDVASSTRHPRPKAGVYAVRQGPPLHANLCRYLQGEALQPYVPQQQALALISAGDRCARACLGCLLRRALRCCGGDSVLVVAACVIRYAVSSYGSWPTLQGRWLWSVKDCIDRAFMRRYS